MAKIIFALLGGFFLGAVIVSAMHRTYRSRQRHRTHGKHTAPKAKMETSKKVIWICLINGIAWVWFSYILAALDKVQIAESLSQVAVTEIIGVVLTYCIKSVIENLSKNNRWPDKKQPENEDGQGDCNE